MIKLKPKTLTSILILALLASCSNTGKHVEHSEQVASQEVKQEVKEEVKQVLKEFTECEDPRPMICTLEYNPVCGFDQQNNAKLYASPCDACGKQEVIKFYMGECEE